MTTSPVKLFGEEISPKRRESPRERIARKALEEKNMNSPLFKALQDESNKRELPNKEILKRVEYFQELPKFSPQDLEEIYLHLEHFWSPRRPMEVFQEVKEKKFLSKLMEQGQKEKIIQHFSKIPERLQLYFLSGPLGQMLTNDDYLAFDLSTLKNSRSFDIIRGKITEPAKLLVDRKKWTEILEQREQRFQYCRRIIGVEIVALEKGLGNPYIEFERELTDKNIFLNYKVNLVKERIENFIEEKEVEEMRKKRAERKTA